MSQQINVSSLCIPQILIIIFFLGSNFLQASENILDQNKIYKNLRCLVCQGQSVADSNSEFAQTIKLVVGDLIKEGKSEHEIYSFLSEKYVNGLSISRHLIKLIFYCGFYLISLFLLVVY